MSHYHRMSLPPLASKVMVYVVFASISDRSSLLSSSDICKAAASSASAASTFSGNSDSVITQDQDPGEKALANFLLRHKKILLLLPVRREEGEVICIWQPAAVRRERRLGPWLCDTGFCLLPFSVQLLFCEPHRYLCLPKILCSQRYQICPKMQGDFQKKYIRY